LKRIYDEAKKACEHQLTGQRPGMLIMRFLDLAPWELKEIGVSDKSQQDAHSVLQLIASRLLSSGRRQHMHTISFLARGGQPVPTTTLNRNKQTITWQASGPTYTFFNDKHPLAKDARYNCFRT